MSKGDEPIGTASNRTPSNCAQMGIHPRAIRNDIKTFISSSTRLRYLLNLFFDEYHYLYPCIDQDRFDIQLQGLFEHYSVHQDCLFLSAGEPESLVFAALTCKILAIAEHIEADGQSPTTTTNELPPERNVRGRLGTEKVQDSWAWRHKAQTTSWTPSDSSCWRYFTC